LRWTVPQRTTGSLAPTSERAGTRRAHMCTLLPACFSRGTTRTRCLLATRQKSWLASAARSPSRQNTPNPQKRMVSCKLSYPAAGFSLRLWRVRCLMLRCRKQCVCLCAVVLASLSVYLSVYLRACVRACDCVRWVSRTGRRADVILFLV